MDRIHVHLENGAKCWFTSDQHYCHSNVMRFCNRPWEDVKEMNKALTDNWNEVVSENDIVFMLGDFYWAKDPWAIVKKLQEFKAAQIFILQGNHDSADQFSKIRDGRIQVISDTAMIWISGIDDDKPSREYEFMLSHFPLATWPHFQRGSINLHGHIHSGPRTKVDIDRPGFDLILKPGKTYDVGVDNNNYYPVEIRDILTKLKRR